MNIENKIEKLKEKEEKFISPGDDMGGCLIFNFIFWIIILTTLNMCF